MAQGTIKWYDAEQAYGFIIQDDGPDVFVHYGAISADGNRIIAEGARVEFDLPCPGKDTVEVTTIGSPGNAAAVVTVLGVGEARPARTESPSRHARPLNLPLAQHRTAFLIETLGGAAVLARFLGVSTSQSLRWSSGTESPSPLAAQKLLDLDHVWAKAMMIWPQAVALQWLSSPNSALSGAQPVELVLQGRAAEVVVELETLEQSAMG